jgi:hypothetical protein
MEVAKNMDGPLRHLHRKTVRERPVEGPGDRIQDMKSRVSSRRVDIAKELTAYGEEEAATRIMEVSTDDYTAIEERAFKFACSIDPASGRPMLIAKALSMAAICVLEGKERALNRNRRKLGR